jgi:hypothetical protein
MSGLKFQLHLKAVMTEAITVSSHGKSECMLQAGSVYLIAEKKNVDPAICQVVFDAILLPESTEFLRDVLAHGHQIHLYACRGRATEYQLESAGHVLIKIKDGRYLFEILEAIDLEMFRIPFNNCRVNPASGKRKQ